MAKAPVDILEQIHAKIAQDMLDRLNSGECEAKEWAVIVKFLKDNNIDALADAAGDGDDAFAALVRRATDSIGQYRQ